MDDCEFKGVENIRMIFCHDGLNLGRVSARFAKNANKHWIFSETAGSFRLKKRFLWLK